MTTSNTIRLLQAIDEATQRANRRELTPLLCQLKQERRIHFTEALNNQMGQQYALALLKILLLELDEEEEESIEIAELAYIACSRNITSPEEFKTRVLLLHYFYDYFTDAVISVFLEKYRKSELLQARSLAIESLEKMQLADLFTIEQLDRQFINNDRQLIDASNDIETNPNLSHEELVESGLMHKVIYAYLTQKYR